MFSLIPLWIWAAVAAFFIGLATGWRHEAIKFDQYRAAVIAQAKAQADHTAEVEARHDKQTKDISDAYNRRLADLRAKYGRLYPDTNDRAMPPTGDSAAGVNDYTPDHLPSPGVLASQCAETTLQLTALQDWVTATSQE